MNDITLFKHGEFGNLRTAFFDGRPVMGAIDVAKALGYSNAPQAVRAHCKGVLEISTPSAGGSQVTKFIPEADVFRLIMRSKLPSAEAFQDWVCEEVLPLIRKTGTYSVPNREPVLEWSEEACILRAKAKAEQMLADHLFQKMMSDLEVKAEPAGKLSAAPLARDRIDRWLHERCVFQIQFETPQMELYRDYVTWCNEKAFRAVSRKRFGLELNEREMDKERRGPGYVRFGIGLKDGANGKEILS